MLPMLETAERSGAGSMVGGSGPSDGLKDSVTPAIERRVPRDRVVRDVGLRRSVMYAETGRLVTGKP